MDYLKAFSLERTFSNWLIKVLLQNFQEYEEETVIRQPWKHMIPPHDLEEYEIDEDVHIYLPIKDPYKWVVSYFRGWVKTHLQKSHYENNPDDVISQYMDHLPPTADDRVFFNVLLDKYNLWCHSALNILDSHEKSVSFTYDEMLHNPTGVLESTAKKFDLTPPYQANWQIEGKEVVTGQNVRNKSYDDSFWTQGEYWNYLSDWQIEMIDEKINWEATKLLGIDEE